jgi:glucokinase
MIRRNLKMAPKAILAVDIGGTKIASGLVRQDGTILSRRQEPTGTDGPQQNISQIIGQLESLLLEAELTSAEITGIGIGIPAMLERETDLIIWGPNLNGWRNIALRPEIENHFHVPVCIEYDGHTSVLGEAWVGVGRGYHSLVDVIIGTGVGGGMILDDRLVRGHNRLAGAVGWFTLNAEAPELSTRDRALGSWEARIAGPGIALRAAELLSTGKYADSLLAKEQFAVTSREVFLAARADDLLATRISNEFADLLGLGIGNIVSLLNPEVVILGGSVGSHAGFLIPRILEVVKACAQPVSGQAVQIIESALAGDAGLLGAAYSVLLKPGN